MAKTRKIFISDIHLSSKALYEDTSHPAWYNPKIHNPRLIGFLDGYVIANKNRIKDLILLGDVFNTWVCPATHVPPTYQEIFDSNPVVMEKLREVIRAGINVFYLNGNHDFDLHPEQIRKVLPDIQVIRFYRSGLIHAEHGHRFDIYNKPDFVTDPAYGRPIGYFISRLVSTENGQDLGLIDLAGYLDDIIEAALTSQNIFSSIIEGLAEKAGLKDEDAIQMPHDKRITIADLKERFDRLDQVYSSRELLNDLYQRRYLNAPADRLCLRFDYKVVVFGHTHNAMLDKDFFLVKDRIYANTGGWCKQNAYCVEIDKPVSPGRPIKVWLQKIDDRGKVVTKDRLAASV